MHRACLSTQGNALARITRRQSLAAISTAALQAQLPAFAASLSRGASASIDPPTLPGKLVFAHYMVSGRRSLNNQARPPGDYYDRNYLQPTGENGAYSVYGGYSRNRPKFRAPLDPATYMVQDAMFEVSTARQYAIDGFAMWIPNSLSATLAQLDAMWQGALSVDPGFLMRLMPDMDAGIGSYPDAQFVEIIKRFAAKPNTMRLADGSVVLSPYRPENKPWSWWNDIIHALGQPSQNADGSWADPIAVAFVPIMLQYHTEYWQYVPAARAAGVWGGRSPATNNPAGEQSGWAATVHQGGRLWVQNLSFQDVRPIQKTYDEALGTLNLETACQLALSTQADWVDLETWNDPAEHTGFYISQNFDNVALELWRRLGQTWRSGVDWQPDDSFFVLHRPHFFADMPTWSGYTKDASGKYTSVMTLRPFSSAPQDIIDVTSWFRYPTDVTVRANGVVVDAYLAPAGHNRHPAALHEGAITVTATTSGIDTTLQTPVAVTRQPFVQDLSYWGAWKTAV